ncbi:MAG: nucleoside hydrolase, partial [Anaerolineales bacterium]|nr:nucleoside hydrolase [Anaerolineales bacterium]
MILGTLLLLGTAYTREGSNQKTKEASQAVKIIFDTDLSGDWDDVGATATLHGLADLGEAEILGMCVSAGGYAAQWAPRCLDAFNTYYGRPDIPIGVVKDMGSTESVYIREIAKNWPHDLTSEEVWDATELYRKILSGQPDTSVVIVTVGYLSNMEDLLQSGPDQYSDLDGTDLVNKKVKRWVCMGGKFPEGSESNLYSEPAASKYAIENWPRPILFSGIEIGNAIRSGQTLVRTSADNPIRRAYEICCGYVGGHHNSWDQTAVLAAVRNPLQYWDVETSGHMEITDDRASNAWRASPDKDHNYLKLKGEEEEVELVINDLMADVPFPWSDKDKLVANYKFNELVTDIAPDASGNGNTGVFVGNHSWVEGRSGQAASFGEGSKFMYIENNDSFFFRKSGFSLAFWFYYPESVPEERQILVKRNLYYNEYLGVYMNGSDHTMGFQVKWDSVPGHTAILPDTWHHVTVTMDHEKARIYLDGKLEGEQTINIKKLYF